MEPAFLRPFFRYFGAKWKSAPRYPAPVFDTIVEPFAGAAGYSLRHYRRSVVLVEKNPVVAGVWKYILGATDRELAAIPDVAHVDELPAWVPQEGRWLVGFRLCAGDSRPRSAASPMVIRDGGTRISVVAKQAQFVRHWKIIEGDYSDAPNAAATWFIDAPYQIAGARATAPKDKGRVRYPNGADDIDFEGLSDWTRGRAGQVIACENAGARWLPFRPLGAFASAKPGGRSEEVVWLSE
jgi:hypothetical protein